MLPLTIVAKSNRGETYALTFDGLSAASRIAAKRTLGDWAANPDLDFTYRDAAVAAICARLFPDNPQCETPPNWWTT